MENNQTSLKISDEVLRDAIKKEYSNVAKFPNKGYHFHAGCTAADRIGYDPALYTTIPKENIESFCGKGNPFTLGPINEGDSVVDVGSGLGFDSFQRL
jgi:arsenite methyltransferase